MQTFSESFSKDLVRGFARIESRKARKKENHEKITKHPEKKI